MLFEITAFKVKYFDSVQNRSSVNIHTVTEFPINMQIQSEQTGFKTEIYSKF